MNICRDSLVHYLIVIIKHGHQIWSSQQDYHRDDPLQHDQQPCVYFSSEQLWHCQQSGKRQMCIVQTNFTSSSSSVNGIVIIIIIIVNTWRDPPKTGSKINGSCAVAELSVKTYTPRLSADTDIFQIRSSSVSFLSYFSLHYQGSIDFNTVNIHGTEGMYT